MNREEIKKLHKFEQFYWWHVGRRYIVDSLLKSFLKNKKEKILEIGCGTGGNAQIFKKYANVVIGLDISSEALKFCQDKSFDKLQLGCVEDTGLNKESFDVVLALDVLEHIKNDTKAIYEVYRVLKPGGVFLTTVPAYQFLWSEHDRALSHYRRYLLNNFLNKIDQTGFKVLKASYCVSFVFPIVLIYRMWRKIIFSHSRKKNIAYVSMPDSINSFFIYVLKLEAFLLKYINFPFGTSIICLVQKPINKKIGKRSSSK